MREQSRGASLTSWLISVLVLAVALAIAMLSLFSCTEITTSLSPGDVNVNQPTIPPDTTTTAPPGGDGVIGSIILEPSVVEVQVGSNVNVKVIVRDASGNEVPSENVTARIQDQTILALVEVDGRTITFNGLAVGTTSVIVGASGLQTSLVATVIP